MSTNLAVVEQPRPKSVILDMANKFGMEARAFEQTLRATVFPGNAPPEEFAAFLLVAKQYDLNPITKEIYAFPKRGGGIVPIVSIDGWMKLINSHPKFDGMDFEDCHDEKGELISTKCTIFRKDRAHPVSVTEYLSECVRATDPWKMKHRMLRHKSAIQCARYAFGFAGVYEEDEAERIVEARDVTPRRAGPPPPAIAAPIEPVKEPLTTAPRRAPPPPQADPAPPASTFLDPVALQSQFATALCAAYDEETANDAYTLIVGPHEKGLAESELEDFLQMLRNRIGEIEP